MNMLSSFLIAVGLSMDNLAVCASAGCARSCHKAEVLWQISLLFALAHFAMFSLGFEGGILLHASRSVGPWIACAILVVIGLRMIKSSFSLERGSTSEIFTSLKTQVALAVATSLDALFVGAGMALAQAPFWQTQGMLVVCVFVTSLLGFYVGGYLSRKWGSPVELAGGAVLVLLGIKVLLDGVGIW